MVVLDLRTFDIAKGVDQSFLGIPTLSGNPILSRIPKFSGNRPDPEENFVFPTGRDISSSRTVLWEKRRNSGTEPPNGLVKRAIAAARPLEDAFLMILESCWLGRCESSLDSVSRWRTPACF